MVVVTVLVVSVIVSMWREEVGGRDSEAAEENDGKQASQSGEEHQRVAELKSSGTERRGAPARGKRRAK